MTERKHKNPNMERRVSVNGRVYYVNLDTVKQLRTKDIKPFMHSKDDPYYLAYFERKQKIKKILLTEKFHFVQSFTISSKMNFLKLGKKDKKKYLVIIGSHHLLLQNR
jgi:hypothetical protein